MKRVDQAFVLAYDRAASAAAPRPGQPEAVCSEGRGNDGEYARAGSRRGVQLAWPATVRAVEHAAAEGFQGMAQGLVDARQRRSGGLALLFTSLGRGVGRTTLVLALARVLGRQFSEERVLVVDGDLAAPALARLLQLRPGAGLDDVVLDRRPLSDALVYAPRDRLTVLPTRRLVPDVAVVHASPVLRSTLAALRRRYSLVLIDGGLAADAAGMGSAVDGAVLIVPQGGGANLDRRPGAGPLEQSGIPVLGWAETFVTQGARGASVPGSTR